MQPITLTTLADYRDRYDLRALCPACHNTRLLDPEQLEATYGANVVIDEIAKHLRCSACGHG